MVSKKLMEDVKSKLRVTWDYDDSRIEDIIERARIYICKKCNEAFDFELTGDHKTLFLERCFYDFNNANSDFEKNYGGELAALILDAALSYKKEDQEQKHHVYIK